MLLVMAAFAQHFKVVWCLENSLNDGVNDAVPIDVVPVVNLHLHLTALCR
jgi:hypothetical protein